MKIAVKNWNAESVGEIDVLESVFSVSVRKDILSRVVQWQLACRRSGNHKVKGKSDVSGTGKKPWKQKGTGRARASSLRSAQFRGGGVVFGPVVRDHGYSLQKKIRQLGLRMALSCKLAENRLVVLEEMAGLPGKTRAAIQGLEKLGVGSVLLVGAEFSQDVRQALQNIPGVDVLPQVGLNVYDILKHEHLVLSRESVEYLQRRLA